MSKEAEINYLKKLTEAHLMYTLGKPFSATDCANYLIAMAAVMTLLPDPPATLLDIGCGAGWTSVFLAKRGYDVTGVDISPDMIRYANEKREHEGLENLRFVVGDYEHMTFEDEFDCALFFDSLHHAEDEGAAVRMAHRTLRRGGVCVASEPGKAHEKSEHARKAVRQYNVTEKDMPPSRIIAVGRRVGFRRFRICPHAASINEALYGQIEGGLWQGLCRVTLFSTLAVLFAMLVHKRDSGIVVMTK